jgi:uncharacterized membrane protein YoaK (UPF0700 family)
LQTARSASGLIGQDAILALLAAAAGTLDVLGFLRLGPALMSAMTGNAALFGLAIGQHQLVAALHSGAAFGGFVIGVATGALMLGDAADGWSPRVTYVITIETAMLGVFSLLWLASGDQFQATVGYVLVLLASAGMGLQSAAVRQLKIPGVTTTFFTGTLTSVVISAVRTAEPGPGRRKLPSSALPQSVALAAYVGAAACAGLAASSGVHAIALLPVAALLVVLVGRAAAAE